MLRHNNRKDWCRWVVTKCSATNSKYGGSIRVAPVFYRGSFYAVPTAARCREGHKGELEKARQAASHGASRRAKGKVNKVTADHVKVRLSRRGLLLQAGRRVLSRHADSRARPCTYKPPTERVWCLLSCQRNAWQGPNLYALGVSLPAAFGGADSQLLRKMPASKNRR